MSVNGASQQGTECSLSLSDGRVATDPSPERDASGARGRKRERRERGQEKRKISKGVTPEKKKKMEAGVKFSLFLTFKKRVRGGEGGGRRDARRRRRRRK